MEAFRFFKKLLCCKENEVSLLHDCCIFLPTLTEKVVHNLDDIPG